MLNQSCIASDKTHHAISVFRLQVNTAHHINPDHTFLWSTLRKLSELTGRSWNSWVIRQWVNLE